MVRSFLYEFENIRRNVLFDELGGGSDLHLLRDQSILTTQITVEGHRDSYSDVVRWISVDMNAYQVKQDVQEPIYNDPFYAQYFQYYSLPSLLSTYGPPDNVFIGIELAGQMGGLDQYYLALDYSKSGWTALITMAASQKEGSIYMACPKRGGFTSLKLWQPKEGGIPSLAPFTLKEATKLDLGTFYKQFKEPTMLCLETDVDKLNFPQ